MRGAGERVGCRGLPGCSIMRAFLPFANIGVLRAGRAQPLYLLTPAGRFGPLAQVPTGHTLPSGTRMVSLPRKYRRSVRWPRTALVFAHAFRSLWASGPSAHRAHASFRRTSRSLWASGPTAHRADAPLRCPKNLCRSTKRKRCERPKGARNAARPTFPKVPRTPLCLHQKKPPAPAQAGTGGHKARRINQANGFSVGYGSDAGRL